MYRFSVWVKRPVQGNGHFYLGTHGYGSVNGVLNRSDGSNNTNPYFTINTNWGEWGDNSSWYLVVGHVWPAGSGTGSNHSDSGIYDTNGNLIYTADLADFVWRPETTSSNHRSYLYYSTDTSTRQQWAYPRVDLIDGNEPSIQSLISNAPNITVYDSSGNNNIGTTVNFPEVTNGQFGNALSFDGVDDKVSISNSPSLELSSTDEVTLEAWIYPTGDPTDSRGTIISKSGSYYMQHYIDDRIAVYTYHDGGSSTYFYSTSTVTRNAWNHVAFTENSSGYRKIYINGQLAGEGQFEASIKACTHAIEFGTENTYRHFKGKIDEARIYNRALSEDEILAHFNASKVRLDYGDVRFTDSNGTTLLNYWMEQDGTFWVKVPSISASSQKTIYMYYGNTGATSQSNGSNTFDFFDDFTGMSLDSDKWSATGSHSVGNALRVNTGSVYSNSTVVSSPQDRVFETKIQWHTFANTYGGMHISDAQSFQGSNAGGQAGILWMSSSDTNPYLQWWAADGSTTGYNIASGALIYNSLSINTYYIGGFEFHGSSEISAFLKDSDYNEIGRNTASGTFNVPVYQYVGAFTGSGAGTSDIDDVSVDWVRIRKYTSPEPTISIYAEQSNYTFTYRKPVTIDNTSNTNTLYDYQVLVEADTA